VIIFAVEMCKQCLHVCFSFWASTPPTGSLPLDPRGINLTVCDICLPCISQLNKEVERLTAKDVRAALAKFFTQGRVTKLRQLIVGTKRVDQSILAAVGQTSDYDMNSMLCYMMYLLCRQIIALQ